MTWPSKRTIALGVGALAACAVSFIGGRWSVKPVEKIVTTKGETAFLYATHAKEQKVDKGRTHTVKVTEQKPGGYVLTTETTDQLADLTLTLDTLTNSSGTASTSTSEITRSLRPDWRIGVGVLTPLDGFKLRYAVEADRRVLGPFSLGARGVLAPDDWRRSQVGLVLSLTH